MMKLVKLFFLSYPLFIVMDTIWLGVVMPGVYQQQLGFLMNKGTDVNWLAALVVWALIVFGALVFALPQSGDTVLSGVLWGALYGLVLYGVYDLTNLALVKSWPLLITAVDIAWGMFVNGLLVGFLVWLKGRL